MNKDKSKRRKSGSENAKSEATKKVSAASAWRETLESVIIAVILAFLFRGFVAEAFVIPTGSMAPTLQGRHKDVSCPKCDHQYRVGASREMPPQNREVVGTRCPICGYGHELDKSNPNELSFTGDRILVNKFSYWLKEPQRWDVIVFKYPGNAVQNYIKRLVGLPNESIKIYRGDIYVKKKDAPDSEYKIARKPPHKLLAMLQIVDDTNHVPEQLKDVGWPNRWQFWSPEGANESDWQLTGDKKWAMECKGGDKESFVRYRHLVPSQFMVDGHHEAYLDWNEVERGSLAPGTEDRPGMLVTDYYTYNDQRGVGETHSMPAPCMGFNWVGDLAAEFNVQVDSAGGELILDLVEGGTHFEARIDTSTGKVTLQATNGQQFGEGEGVVASVSGTTPIKGAGSYDLRFANVDDEITLWVNNSIIKFDGPTTYVPPKVVAPKWSLMDPGDIAPAGIGSKGAKFLVKRARIYRDIYYLAQDPNHRERPFDYRLATLGEAYTAFTHPEGWSETNMFEDLTEVTFQLDEDQFFPLGDNSPHSRDARIWYGSSDSTSAPGNYVHRRLLIGKAIMIYWPHAWRRPVPFLPNVQRMGLIR